MRKRIDAAGVVAGRANVKAWLKPGKRGKYEIFFMLWEGWNRDREEEIKIVDALPERPQIIHWVARLESLGRYRRTLDYAPLLIISHHVLSRTGAQEQGMAFWRGKQAEILLHDQGVSHVEHQDPQHGEASKDMKFWKSPTGGLISL
jgi:hypothetical protein